MTFSACSAAPAWAGCSVTVESAESFGQLALGEVPEKLDSFGSALAKGDFDGDGRVDLVIGAPREGLAGQKNVGSIHIRYARGRDQTLQQNSIPGAQLVPYAHFGASLAAGDFNADGYDDLVVTSAASTAAAQSARYFVLPGSSQGLKPSLATFIAAEQPVDLDNPMTVGDFDSDGYADLAVGQPSYQGSCPVAAGPRGRVVFAFGSAGTVRLDRTVATSEEQPYSQHIQCGGEFARALIAANLAGEQRILVGEPGYDTAPTANGGSVLYFVIDANGEPALRDRDWVGADDLRYGAAFAAGDFNSDGAEDVVIGVPWDLTLHPTYVGGVWFHYHDGNGEYLFRNDGGWQPDASGAGFGSRLASGDFNGDGVDDVAFGEPNFRSTDVGAFLVALGSADGPSFASKEITEVDLGQQEAPHAQLGNVLLAADRNFDGRDELLIGVPAKSDESVEQAGAVYSVQLETFCN